MKSFIKISLRRLSRERIYAIVNILGLALGMASALLIFLYLRYETTYDRQHPDYVNTYRLGTELRVLGTVQNYAVSSAALAPALVEEFDEFSDYLRVFHVFYFLRDLVYQYQDVRVFEKDVFAVDPSFFRFFGAEFLEGDGIAALDNPFDMVLTRSLAEQFFGKQPALGMVIHVPDAGNFTVRAVVEDVPLNTHFRYRVLISLSTLNHLSHHFRYAFGPGIDWQTFEGTFGSTVVWSYVKAREDFDAGEFLRTRWDPFHQQHILPIAQEHLLDSRPIFQPLAAIHMDKGMLYDRNTEKVQVQALDRSLVRVFFAIALFLLIVAAINYANIAISNFNKRRMEMAMVKVLGSGGLQVFTGFFTEAMVTALIGLVLGLVLLEMIIPGVNVFLNAELALDFTSDGALAIIVLLVLLLTALMAALSPALYFARTRVAQLLLYRKTPGRRSVWLKRVLVCLQFSISAFMITSSFLVYRQMDFVQQKDTGYKVENIAAIELQGHDARSHAHLLDSLLQTFAGVEKTAKTAYVFTMMPITNSVLMQTTRGPIVKSINNVQTTGAYLDLMGISVSDEPADVYLLDVPGNIFINQALADTLGFEEVTGRTITTHFQFLDGRMRADRQIAGVIDNVHYALLNEPPPPLVLLPLTGRPNYLVVKFSDTDRQMQEDIIHQAWQQYDAGSKCAFFFPEDVVQEFYLRQERLSQFFGYFAWLCVLISFLGVFGITAYNLEQRTPEIAIRKIMGAGWWDVFSAFFKDYVFLLLVALPAGGLVAYLSLMHWLSGFAYAVKLTIGPFVLAAMLVAFTVMLAVAIHAWRSHFINPSRALRST